MQVPAELGGAPGLWGERGNGSMRAVGNKYARQVPPRMGWAEPVQPDPTLQ